MANRRPTNGRITDRSALLQDTEDGYGSTTSEGSVNSNEEPEGETSGRFWKNLAALCLSFFFTFTAFTSIQNLASTLYHSAGLGVVSLACMYASVTLACFFSPSYIVAIGPKWGIVTGLGAQVLFTAANFYPKFFTLVPASIILGLASGPMWIAQGVYITQLATDYADLIMDEVGVYISRFNGIFFLILQSSQIAGNLVSSLVLFSGSNTPETNTTNTSGQCGASFCHFDSNNGSSSHSTQPSQHMVYLLLGIYAGCSVAGLLLFTFAADNRPQPNTGVDKSPKTLAVSTFKAHGNALVLLLVPLFLWTGMEQSFMFGEYTQVSIIQLMM